VLPPPKALGRESDQLYEALDAACSGWLRAAHRLLDALSNSPELLVTHVVVGNSQLVPLLAKLLLSRLDACVGVTQVYSASAVPKVAAFRRIRAKYGARTRYIVLGGSIEEEAAAGLLAWPFVRVTLAPPPAPTAAAPAAPGPAAAAPAAAPGAAAGAEAGADAAPAAEKAAGLSSKPRASSGAGSGDAAAEGDEAEAAAAADTDGDAEEEDDAAKAAAGGRDAAANGAAAAGGGGGSSEPAGAPGPHVALDALGSLGHTMMQLTADQLIQLALSLK
jgi:hypothetical protein